MKNNTWTFTTLSERKKPIELKWIFKSKFLLDGTLHKRKARLVKGCSQVCGVDFEEVFSLVTRLEMVRMFLAIAVKNHWLVFQLYGEVCISQWRPSRR